MEVLPSQEEIETFGQGSEIQEMRLRFKYDLDSLQDHLHLLAKEALDENDVERAWLILLQKS